MYQKFVWSRTNTIDLFMRAEKEEILEFSSSSPKQHTYEFQPVLFQFQCIVTTTDAYCRVLSGHGNVSFGVLVDNAKVTKKKDLTANGFEDLLEEQKGKLQSLLESSEKTAEEKGEALLAILNHEYLHQGELIVMFREAGAELPEKFQKAFAL
jgi:hypothetical protein